MNDNMNNTTKYTESINQYTESQRQKISNSTTASSYASAHSVNTETIDLDLGSTNQASTNNKTNYIANSPLASSIVSSAQKPSSNTEVASAEGSKIATNNVTTSAEAKPEFSQNVNTGTYTPSNAVPRPPYNAEAASEAVSNATNNTTSSTGAKPEFSQNVDTGTYTPSNAVPRPPYNAEAASEAVSNATNNSSFNASEVMANSPITENFNSLHRPPYNPEAASAVGSKIAAKPTTQTATSTAQPTTEATTTPTLTPDYNPLEEFENAVKPPQNVNTGTYTPSNAVPRPPYDAEAASAAVSSATNNSSFNASEVMANSPITATFNSLHRPPYNPVSEVMAAAVENTSTALTESVPTPPTNGKFFGKLAGAISTKENN